jgi:hypothetical protein
VNQLDIEMRVPGDPMAMLPTVRKIMAQIDPDMPLLDPMTQSAVFEQSILQQALFARLAGCFGILAVVLIATGLYGTLAYRVSRRSAEIGIRTALGAQRSQGGVYGASWKPAAMCSGCFTGCPPRRSRWERA